MSEWFIVLYNCIIVVLIILLSLSALLLPYLNLFDGIDFSGCGLEFGVVVDFPLRYVIDLICRTMSVTPPQLVCGYALR